MKSSTVQKRQASRRRARVWAEAWMRRRGYSAGRIAAHAGMVSHAIHDHEAARYEDDDEDPRKTVEPQTVGHA